MAFLAIENTASSSSIPSPAPPSDDEYTYDVFLSFRGTDTRNNFTDHLYYRLKQKGIFTFRDDERLERGTLIAPELFRAIKESRIAVVILSSDYASSRWCLAELAKIVECMEMRKLRLVLPVFHYVDPRDVRNQRSTFGEAFEKHNERCKDNIEDLQRWRAALTKVADIAGWTLHSNIPESKVIEDIVKKIEDELKFTYSFDYKDLVGINCRLEELENLLDMVLDEVRLIGIWGTGGMGKTTLAKVVYDKFRYEFQGSSFLANVREESGKHGIVHLQKKLLSDILIETDFDFPDFRWGSKVIEKRLCHKKVLIILDDVDQPEQLEALVGEQSWFGQGSRIIITTRDQHLLIRHEVAKAHIYKVKGLNNDDSLKLFSQKAFNKKDQTLKAYVEMSQKFIDYAQGLPLALKVLSSFLCHRSLNLWDSALAKFKENPPKDILDVLKISFDGLEEREKSIYLDIACFFNGMARDCVTKLLQILYDKPDIDIDVLLKKSLVTISWDCFQMHDLLQELGREIVRRESPQEAGERSRLWHSEDVYHVLKENTGTDSVKGIFLESPPKKERHLNVEAFPKMKNLRLLKISNVHLPQGLNYLSSELRSIHWAGYPLESLPTSFEPEKLVELIMRSSLIKQLWKGFKSCDKLKHIDLSDSKNLIEISDLSGVPNLEQLILQGCTTLHRIHESLGNLKRLILLDLNNCKCLERLPHKINLESLEFFNLSSCSKLIKFPKVVGSMSHLSKLYLCKIPIKALPLPLEHLTSLTELNLSDCKDLDELPKNLGNMKGLEELNVSRTAIKELPSSIIQLSNLKGLLLRGCTSLQSVPKLSLNLRQLILQGCTSLSKIHASLGNLKLLVQLDLDGCKCLESLPHKISLEALGIFILSGCSRLKKFPEVVGNMSCLSKLSLNETAITGLPLSIEHLIGLIELDLRDCKNLSSLPNGCYSSMSLESLNLSGCSKLVKLPENLGNIKTLKELDVSRTAITGLPLSIEHLIGLIKLILIDCKNLLSLPDGCYSSMSLKILSLSGCSKLDELPENLGKIESLEVLDLSGTAIRGLPSSFVHLKNLKFLSLSGCVGPSSRRSPDPMVMLERSLIGLCSLIKLDLSYCYVQTIPNVLGCLSSLVDLNLSRNNFVCLPESIIQLSKLRELDIGGCTHLRMLPKLPLNIDHINATTCTSLETLSLRPESNFRPNFNLLSCDKLIKNQGHGDLVSTMLRRYIINTQDQHIGSGCSLVIPGSEIPKWFSHQNVGGSVNLQLPPDLLGNKLMGIVVCVVFVFRKHYPFHQLHKKFCRGTHLLHCFVGESRLVGHILSEEFDKIESYQLWLYYFSLTHTQFNWKGIFNQVNANEFGQIELKFEPEGPGLEVTKCGAHLVFKRDIEDVINQTKAWPSSCIITPYDEDGFEDSEKDTKIKRSSDDSDGEGAGPSGEATSNDIDIPHPKSVQLPNLIQRLMLCLGNWIGSLCSQRQGDSDCEEEEFQ